MHSQPWHGICSQSSWVFVIFASNEFGSIFSIMIKSFCSNIFYHDEIYSKSKLWIRKSITGRRGWGKRGSEKYCTHGGKGGGGTSTGVERVAPEGWRLEEGFSGGTWGLGLAAYALSVTNENYILQYNMSKEGILTIRKENFVKEEKNLWHIYLKWKYVSILEEEYSGLKSEYDCGFWRVGIPRQQIKDNNKGEVMAHHQYRSFQIR